LRRGCVAALFLFFLTAIPVHKAITPKTRLPKTIRSIFVPFATNTTIDYGI
jgi:hypothetical protein